MQHMIALRFLNVFLLSHRESSTRKSVVWNFRKFMEKHMRWSLFFIKISTLLKRDSKTVFFPWILKNFYEHLFYRTPPSDLFMDKNLCCLLTRIWLNSIFHWRVHAFVCILILYLFKVFQGCIITENSKYRGIIWKYFAYWFNSIRQISSIY